MSSKKWDICGHQKIIDFLQSAAKNDKLAQAYLLVGQAHLGKQTLVNHFAKAILCQNGHIGCGECFNCQQIDKGHHPDVYQVVVETNEKTGKLKKDIAIAQIRDLKNKLQQSTLLSGYKVAIIPQAQYLNKSAADALLKVLEEPTPKTVIVLIVDDIEQVPATIVSRCQVLRFLPVSNKKIEEYLKNLGAEETKAKQLSRLSQGRPGIAISYLENEETLQSYLADIDNFFRIMDSDINRRFTLADEVIDWAKDEVLNIKRLNKLFSHWQLLLRDLLLIKSDNEPLVSNFSSLLMLKKRSQTFSYDKIRSIIIGINEAKKYFNQNINTKLTLENLILKI